MSTAAQLHFGVVDNRFLTRSIGLLNPPSPITLRDTETIQQGLQLLKEHSIGCVLLTDSHGRLTGIFTERDVLKKVVLTNLSLDAPLSSLMTRDPQTAEMSTPIAFVLEMMSEGGFRHMPIITGDRSPVGIVSVKDIVDYIVKSIHDDMNAMLE